MTRIVNASATERPIFASAGLPEWLPGEELDVPEAMARQLLDRADGNFALAEGETEPSAAAAEDEAESEAEPAPSRRGRRGAAQQTEPEAATEPPAADEPTPEIEATPEPPVDVPNS